MDEELKTVLVDMKKRKAEVPGFIELIRDGNLIEQEKSADVVGEIGDGQGVLPLIGALNDQATSCPVSRS